jgi:pimeloyl-ACP methyl ester carboxylesterase
MASHYYQWHHGVIHYQKRGWGDPLLLIHNIYPGAGHEEYQRNIDHLSRHFTVHAIDLIGFGQSDAPRMKYTASTYVELIFDFLREQIAEPAHVVASGLSCAYVTEVAAWRSNLFKKLVFICPRSEPTGLDSPRWLAAVRHFLLTTPALGSGFYETIASPYELKNYLTTCYHNPRAITNEKVQQLVDNASRPGTIHPYISLITGYLDCHLLSSLPRVDLPILLIWGREARPTPVEHSVRLVALARKSRLEVIERAGAWVHDEQSAAVNKLITEYLNEDTELPAKAQGA